MILKKPYAFLIKHFRLIHFLLFLVAGYLLLSTNTLFGYTNNFVTTLIYSIPISTVLTNLMYTSIWVLIVGFAVITYLLYYKKKPYIEYVIGIGIYILILILFILLNNYFKNLGSLPDVRAIRALKDFLLMAYIVQYVVDLYLLIKFMGLDLKKFGFKEDKDLLLEDSDAEEVEVALEFDKDKYIRLIKKRARFLKYYFVEYKRIYIPIAIVLLVISIIAILIGHETTRTYSMKEEFSGNSFGFRINGAYLTDRTYNGKEIYSSGTRKYLIVNVDLKNLAKTARRLNLESFNLVTDDGIYRNNYSMYTYFEDLGSRYNDNYLEPKLLYNYIFLFEIEPKDYGKDYYVTYTTGGFRVTTRKVKLDVQDLTNYSDYLTVHKDEEMKLLFYNGKDVNFKIITYGFKDQISYFYDGCKTPDSCGTYLKETNAKAGKKILSFNFISSDIDGFEFSRRLIRHGELIYKIGEEEESLKLEETLQIKYKGNFLYFNVPPSIEKASYLELRIVIRDKVYHYILKDEGENNEL